MQKMQLPDKSVYQWFNTYTTFLFNKIDFYCKT